MTDGFTSVPSKRSADPTGTPNLSKTGMTRKSLDQASRSMDFMGDEIDALAKTITKAGVFVVLLCVLTMVVTVASTVYQVRANRSATAAAIAARGEMVHFRKAAVFAAKASRKTNKKLDDVSRVLALTQAAVSKLIAGSVEQIPDTNESNAIAMSALEAEKASLQVTETLSPPHTAIEATKRIMKIEETLEQLRKRPKKMTKKRRHATRSPAPKGPGQLRPEE